MADQVSMCAFVFDTSMSMSGEPIERLNDGLVVLEEVLRRQPVVCRRVEILIVKAGGSEAEVCMDWCRAADFMAPELDAGGGTPLGGAMAMALEAVAARHEHHASAGVPCTRPWIVLCSDGAPDDVGWMARANACRDAERRRTVSVFPIGIDRADLRSLKLFTRKSVKRLRGHAFDELFLWVGRCLGVVCQATPGQRITLPAARWSHDVVP